MSDEVKKREKPKTFELHELIARGRALRDKHPAPNSEFATSVRDQRAAYDQFCVDAKNSLTGGEYLVFENWAPFHDGSDGELHAHWRAIRHKLTHHLSALERIGLSREERAAKQQTKTPDEKPAEKSAKQ